MFDISVIIVPSVFQPKHTMVIHVRFNHNFQLPRFRKVFVNKSFALLNAFDDKIRIWIWKLVEIVVTSESIEHLAKVCSWKEVSFMLCWMREGASPYEGEDMFETVSKGNGEKGKFETENSTKVQHWLKWSMQVVYSIDWRDQCKPCFSSSSFFLYVS